MTTTIFVRKTGCQKYFLQILSQKNAQIVNLKNPDLDLIRRINPECGLYGFMIWIWILPKKTRPMCIPAPTSYMVVNFPGLTIKPLKQNP